MSESVETQINFIARDPAFKSVKPYGLRYSPPDGQRRENYETSKQELRIQDARSLKPHINTQGFCLASIPTTLQYDEFFQQEKVESVYIKELQSSLRTFFGAQHVRVIDYRVRQRHPDFPKLGDDADAAVARVQPASSAHVGWGIHIIFGVQEKLTQDADFSHKEAMNLLRAMYGDAAEELMKHRWQLINTWRPLKGPLTDWPLAVCDAQSFDLENDAVIADIVYPTWKYENILIHFNPLQRWYYFSDLMPAEVMLFKCTGSDPLDVGPTPHASFLHPDSDGMSMLRESIEARVFVFNVPIAELPKQVGILYGKKE